MIYPLLHAKSVYVFDQHIYCYRLGRDGQSVSLEGWRKHCLEHDKVIRQLLSHLPELEQCQEKVIFQLTQRLLGLIHWQYKLYMALGDKQAQLKDFDRHLKNQYPALFAARKQVEGKRIKLMRMSGFILYPLLRKKELDS